MCHSKIQLMNSLMNCLNSSKVEVLSTNGCYSQLVFNATFSPFLPSNDFTVSRIFDGNRSFQLDLSYSLFDLKQYFLNILNFNEFARTHAIWNHEVMRLHTFLLKYLIFLLSLSIFKFFGF